MKLSSLIGRVVDCLFDVLIFQLRADGFDFKEECQAALYLDRQVAVGAPDHVLGCDLRVLVIAKDVLQQVRDDHYGVGFVYISCFG